MKKMMMVLVMMIGCVLNMMAQSAEINKVWVDHGAYSNGSKGMRIHVKFDINGLKNKKGYVCAYFYDGNKNKAIGRSGDGYHASDGHMSVGESITPTYDNSTYSDLQLFMPYHIFNNLKSGQYYFRITVYSYISYIYKELTRSEWQGFSYTSGNNNNVANNNYYQSNNNNIEFTYTENLTCVQCKGTGKCNLCGGRGVWGVGIGSNSRCVECGGTGKCSGVIGCKGVGYKTYTRDYTPEQLNSKGVTAWNNGNYNHAFQYFQKSASSSYAWGMYNLGHCYELGRGCEKSRAMAIHWYKKAANKDNEEAIKALDRLGVDYNPNGGYANNSNSGNNNNFNSGNYNNSNNNNSNNTRPCYKCKGGQLCENRDCYHGRCMQCQGSGYCYYDYGQFIGCNASHEGAQQCTKCFGRGYCPTCSGTGKCQVCGGRGELTN